MRGKIYKRQKKKSLYISKGTGRTNQIRNRRKIGIKSEREKQKATLYRQVSAKVNKVNRRLVILKQEGYQGTWASRRLYERLDVGKLDSGKIVNRKKYLTLNKKLNMTQLNAIGRASDLFLKSETSTVEGIKRTRESVIKSLQISLGEDNKPISNEDAEFLYDLFNTTKFDDLAKYSSASTLWAEIENYLENKISSEEKLLQRLITYGNLDYKQDLDIRDKANDLLHKLIKRKHPNLTDEEIEKIIEYNEEKYLS